MKLCKGKLTANVNNMSLTSTTHYINCIYEPTRLPESVLATLLF